jgi:hypothetical protein
VFAQGPARHRPGILRPACPIPGAAWLVCKAFSGAGYGSCHLYQLLMASVLNFARNGLLPHPLMPIKLPFLALLLLPFALVACGEAPTSYSCLVTMRTTGSDVASPGQENFTFSPASKTVEMKTMVAGEMKSISIPATVAGDELSFQLPGSTPIDYKLNLKSRNITTSASFNDSEDGPLALKGSGTCITK